MLDTQYSLLVPTYNRPQYLRRMMDFFEGRGVTFAIHLMDGSDHENWEKNREICASVNLNIKHRHFPNDLPLARVRSVLDDVETEYVSLCGEDDILLVDALPEMISFLNENRDYVACQGQYYNFHEVENGAAGNIEMHITRVEYTAPSLKAPTAIERIVEQMAAYESPYYAVIRKDKFGELVKTWLPESNPLFEELFQANGLSVFGKVERIMVPFLLRNTGSGIVGTKKWQTVHWFVEEAQDLFLCYGAYRDRLAEMIKEVAAPEVDDTAIKQALDLAHSIYFYRTFNEDLTFKNIQRVLAVPTEQWQQTINSVLERLKPTLRNSNVNATAQVSFGEGRDWDFVLDKAVIDSIGANNVKQVLANLAPYYPKLQD